MTDSDKDIANKRLLEITLNKLKSSINELENLKCWHKKLNYEESHIENKSVINIMISKLKIEFFDEIKKEYEKLLSENITYDPFCTKEEQNSKDIKEILRWLDSISGILSHLKLRISNLELR